MELKTLLDGMVSQESLDLHLISGHAPAMRLNGRALRQDGAVLDADAIEEMLRPHLTLREQALLEEQRADIDKTLRWDDRAFMLHVFHERGQIAAAIRALPTNVPTLDDLYEAGIVRSLLTSLITQPSGLVIITGHTGSGKITTLAAMIETINLSQTRRIVTIEDPIQYEFVSKQSLITQRNIGEDAASYRDAARSAFREDADVVLIGEMHDLDTLSLALSLADTGHLVLLPVHCERAAQAVYRLSEVFPEPRGHIRRLLARNLLAVVAQALLPRADRPGRVPVNEVLLPTPQVRQLISEGVQELDAAIALGRAEGMQSMDDGIVELFEAGAITEATARAHVADPGRLAAGAKND